MSTASDVSAVIEARLNELDQEQRKLSRALEHLAGPNPPSTSGRPRRSRSRPLRRSEPKGMQRRSRKSGNRADHAVAFVEKYPGSSTKQIAEGLKVQPAYLYRVLPGLVKNGRLKKDGRAYSVVS